MEEKDQNIPKSIGNYTLLEKIGTGSFSSVYKACHISTNTLVAIKVILKSSIPKEKYERELAVLKSLDHPFCIAFFENMEDDFNYYLVQELIQGKSLLTIINSNSPLPEATRRHYFCQLISAFDYLHNVIHFVHRDVKPENIMIDQYGNIRLIDFGLGNVLETGVLKTACGSAAYAAPEVIKGNPYDSKADIWSAGVVLYVMSVGKLPFDDPNIHRMAKKVVYQEPRFPHFLSPDLLDLLQSLLTKDPQKRIDINGIKNHTWFLQHPFEGVLNANFGLQYYFCWRNFEKIKAFAPPNILITFRHFGINVNQACKELETHNYGDTTVGCKIIHRMYVTKKMENLFYGGEKSRRNSSFDPIHLPSIKQSEYSTRRWSFRKSERGGNNESGLPPFLMRESKPSDDTSNLGQATRKLSINQLTPPTPHTKILLTRRVRKNYYSPNFQNVPKLPFAGNYEYSNDII
ncbi:CAMK family protein kinase [Histomonas meleagridis]|uniref:CAMK family protein kinase n=1 Tax=Histomonas meleagridis TaxID=135588 RepID=UPI0035597B67|nr:CAMK family protein kinase [Histomonas meleagridis]KAH0803817.1 CAMK family protein kinase [Histomonas meleagridis]